ncbi:hypothetical protein BS47DRAFT_482836 [Hydnum rufescens UP504]|uniref:Uncharacterized protein n=1 Tax=Hydnum rufescens UP504 TaxID=1448309 RepID=A0A9P6AHL7_9AGAM|nr:hypothetical protein BS47DRAFT_482836 [Hydnum rufescens UP504]
MVALELPSYPSPTESSLHGVHTNQAPSGTVPFDSSDLHNIHLHLNNFECPFFEDTPELVVPAAILKQFAHKYLHRDDLESTPSISWNDWGPHNTCLICPTPRPNPWLCGVRGSRHVWLDTSGTLSVLDFTPNLPVVRPDPSQAQSRALGSIRKMGYDDGADDYVESCGLVHPKGTNLPYHEVKRRLEPSLSEPTRIFIDDEHIVLFVVSFVRCSMSDVRLC